ncbi:unnamed protein product [Closterium sp. NIES-54]
MPCLCSMHSRLLVYGLPRSLPSLPHSPALPCLPCVEGRQRTTPHSSEFPPTTTPLQTLNMDLNLWPRVSEPETSPTLWWTWKVGGALAFRVWGAHSLVRDAKASMLSSRTLRCVFLGFPTNAPPWQFYHLRERRVFSSQDVTFDESDCFYRLHPHASHPGLAPLGVSQVDPPPLVEPLEISFDSSGPAEGGDPAVDDTAATRRSPRLETPLGFPPRSSSPPPQPAVVDSEAETASAELGGARTRGAGAAKAGAAAGAGGAGGAIGATGASGDGGAGAADSAPRRLFFYPQPQSSLPSPDSVLCRLLRGSSLPAPAPHTEGTESLSEHHEPENRASTPVRAHRVARPRPLAVPDTHVMALRPSSVPQRVVLPEPPISSLLHVLDPESDLARAASPTVTRLLATVVTNPDFESTATFVLVIELVDFAARSRLDYVASLVTESESVCPPSIGGELALSSDGLDDRQFKLECLATALPHFASMLLCHEGNLDALDIPTLRSYAEAIVGEYTSQWQTAMDAEMASWKSTGTYVNEVPPLGANIGVDFFQTFSLTPKMTTLQVLLHVAAQRDYELHSLDFSTAFLQGSLHEEIWLRRPPGFAGSFPAGTQCSLRWPAELQERHTSTNLGELRSYLGLQITRDRARHTITLIQSHMVHRVLQRFGFQFSSPQPTPLSTGHSLSAPPSDESVEPSGLVVLTGHSDASWADDQATQHSSQCYTFSLGSGSVSWRSSRSSSVLGSCCEAEIYVGAMAAQDLCWLT